MFDRSLWRTQVGKRLDKFARNPQQDLNLSGSPALLPHLAMCTLRPFFDAYSSAPIAAIQTLASIADGPGADYIVKHAARLRYHTPRFLAQEMQSNSELRVDLEHIMAAIDTIHLVRQRLHGSRADWFCNLLTSELNAYPPPEFAQLRRRLRDNWKSFYDIFRELRQRRGRYTHEDLILLYVGLNDSASNVRAEAARRLGEYAWTPPEKLITRLIQVALYDRDLETRNAAARALGGLCSRILSPQMLHDLEQNLADQDRFVRSSTALLLAELGDLAATESLVTRLAGLLQDTDHYVREAAACALGRMGTAAVRSEVMEALTEALRDTNEDVHGAALDSLTQLRELRTPVSQAAPPAPKPVAPASPPPASAGGVLSESVLSFVELGSP
jgi:hypothetical protein